MKSPKTLSALLALAGVAYATSFWAMITLDPDSAWSRFDELRESGAFGRAVGHGEQAIALRLSDGTNDKTTQMMQRATADAHFQAGDPDRAIILYRAFLDSPLGSQLSEQERNELRNRIASLSLKLARPVDAAMVIADFVDAAGDGAADMGHGHSHAPAASEDAESEIEILLDYANAAIGGFTDTLSPVNDREVIEGDDLTRLHAAERMTNLGGYYARLDNGAYAAAGLLAAAYKTRSDLLGPDHEDTVHTALLLAPVYEQIDRVGDAEKVYLQAFHARERAKGSNNPELTLYIRLLADVYKRQGRLTEAEALNVHMRTIFRDAFGARRYAANQERNRIADVNRPVSIDFPLTKDYAPDDLTEAALFSVPVSKNPAIDEMKVRAAMLDNSTSLPKALADLIGECRSDAERLSLRSGYRSFATQEVLYALAGPNGKVAKPGTSEHQTGLAVDIDVNGRFMRSTDRAYRCFEERAWTYGFILSYPRGNKYLGTEDGFEPWHWRYVGPRTALLYRETGPLGYPQEFLAALPCYEERAVAGLFRSAGDTDICLESVRQDFRTAARTDQDVADGQAPPIRAAEDG